MAYTHQQASADVYGTFQASQAPPRPLSRSTIGARFAQEATWKRHVRLAGVVVGCVLLAGFESVSRITLPNTGIVAPMNSAIAAEQQAVEPSLSEYEQTFMDSVDRAKLRDFLHAYASVPHAAGSEQDYKTAVYTKEQFEAFGIQAEIKEYYTLLSLPVRRHLSIVAPGTAQRELNLTEEAIENDSCTSNEDALPPFFGYTATGNVTASIVYANYGRQEDFKWLAAQNVTLKGKILLARYGSIARDIKIMLAEQYGMAGALIYSDPFDDGFVRGLTYPDGPWRPEQSFQRGGIAYLSLIAGDPLTPGFPSNLDAPYLSIDEVNSIPHIPALPLSYGQAKYILESLGGIEAPAEWQGGLTLTNGYRLGNDEVTVVNLDLEMDNHIAPIWDVIGTIEGAKEPDELVLIGNHRDAWVCGAVDPSSGSSALLELARGFGGLLKNGWRPRRTIKLASWDGEEYSLLGSTEYAEDNAEKLIEKAVAYINVDAFLGPLVSAGGTPSIAEFLLDTAKAVPADSFSDEWKASSLYEQWALQAAARATANNGSTEGMLAPEFMIQFLGSGSDYTVFFQHLGIASANLAFGLTDGAYGVYHSTMDSVAYVESEADPKFATHVTATQWWGIVTLRLANDQILPFDFSTYGPVMKHDLTTFEAKTRALDLDINYTSLYASIDLFSSSATAFHKDLDAFEQLLSATDATANVTAIAARQQVFNEKLKLLERQFLLEEGLAHRPWYKHVIFGPGFFQLYAGTAFPGIADGIAFADDSATIQAHVGDVARVVTKAAQFLVIQ